MRRDIRKYLEDIRLCISELEALSAGKTLDEYKREFLLRRAAEREFIIIAEALSQIGQVSSEVHARLNHVREIAGFRNIIVHHYSFVDDTYVWKIIHESVPILKQQIELWAEELDR